MSRLRFSVTFDEVACGACGATLWIGDDACHVCGTGRRPGGEAEAHLYRARVSTFGPFLDSCREPSITSAVPVTDAQYLSYTSGTDLLDERMLHDVSEAASSLELRTPSDIRGPITRTAAKRLIRHADRYRRILLDLKALRPSGRFEGVNPHLVAAFEAFLETLRRVAKMLVAWSPEEAKEHAASTQPALDRASGELGAARERMTEAFPGGLGKDTPEERVASLLGGGVRLPHGGELRTLGNLAAAGFEGFEQFMARGPEGYRYFSDLLHVPLRELPTEVPPALYLLSLLLNDLDDPVGIRRPASYFLEVLGDAHTAKRKLMLEAAVKVQGSLAEAGATLTTLAPQVEALLNTPGIPEDALRSFLIGVYLDLTEGCFKHVTNLLLFGMFVCKGAPKSWEDISDWSTFGAKHQWLKDAGDEPAWLAALDGVEDIVRNSAAHREYELLEGGVRFVQKDLRARTVERTKVMSNAEFGELVRRLVRTILALSVAAQLFQCDHIREIASDLYGVETPRVLRPAYLQLLLGILGLLNPEISTEGDKVRVRASAVSHRPPAPTEEYLKGLFLVQKFYPEAKEASLEVESHGEWYCSLSAPTDRIGDVVRRPKEANLLGLLMAASISSAGRPERSDEQKLDELGLSLGSRLLVSRLEEVASLLRQGAGGSDLDEKLNEAVAFLKDMEHALLVPLEVPPEGKQRRDDFVGDMRKVRRFYSTVTRVRKGHFGDAGAISRFQPRYEKAIENTNRLADVLPPVERIF